MKNLRLPILLIFGLLSSLASAKEIYVASFGKDSNPGSQNEPYATLGKAFTVLENDDKIFILDILSIQNEASGTGTGQMEDNCLGIKFPSDKKNIVIQGISPEASGIDGTSLILGQRVLLLQNVENLTIKNISITNALKNINPMVIGGGAISVEGGNVTIENCNFDACGSSTLRYGGAIQVDNAIVTLKNCSFARGNASYGGAIYVASGKLMTDNCSFAQGNATLGGAIATQANTANTVTPEEKQVSIFCSNSYFYKNNGSAGGAIAVSNSTNNNAVKLRIESCTFAENSGRGGAISLENKKTAINDYQLINSTIYKNSSPNDAGAIMLLAGQTGETFDLINCTITENTTTGNAGHGAGIRFYNDDSSTSQTVLKRILNCIIENNYATNNGSRNQNSDLSFRHTPEATYLIIKNSFIGSDGNNNINVKYYMEDNLFNYFSAVESLAEFEGSTSDQIQAEKCIPVLSSSLASNYGNPQWLQEVGITTDQKGETRPFTNNRCTIGSVEVVSTLNPGTKPEGTPTYPSYDNLVMAGYQGWFSVKGDDSGNNGYVHCGRDGKFEPGYAGIEFWPDMTEYTKKYPVDFVYPDNSQAYFFSSSDEETVDLHFKWMQQYGIDGVFIQRFISSITSQAIGKVLKHAVKAAKKYNRAFSIMYDCSGLSTEADIYKVLNDWKIINAKYRFSDPSVCPTYLHHNGKPMIALWGIGLQGKGSTPAQFKTMMDNLQDLDGAKQKFSYLLGSSYQWRTGGGDAYPDTKDLVEVLKTADIISPWSVGRYNSIAGFLDRVEKFLKTDILWCRTNNVGYAPVVFPGFSWRNLKNLTVDKYDEIPRLKGDFLWRQIAEAKKAGAKMIYVAMFDELDEGTCIFKCANSKNTPIFATSSDPQGKFLGIDDDLPTDYYLFLAGQAGEWLKGNAEYGDTKPSYKPMGVEQVTDDSPVNVSYANNILTIKSSRTGEMSAHIYNMQGSLIGSLKNTDNGIPFNKTIDISSLPKGVYIIQIVFDGKISTVKIQK